MKKRNTGTLPHKAGVADIASPELKRLAMLFMENFKSLDTRLAAVERKLASHNGG